MAVTALIGQHAFSQATPDPGRSRPAESSVLADYTKFLQDEDKAHREYLQTLYTVTSSTLAFLVAVGAAVIGYAQFKTRKDVEDAVNAKFNDAVDREIRRRMSEITNQLNEFESRLEKLRKDAQQTELTLSDVRGLATDTRALVENKPAEPSVDSWSQFARNDADAMIPRDGINEEERQVLSAIGNSRYSLRTVNGVIQEVSAKGIDADGTVRSIDALSKKGYVDRTLGKKGGERWYVTEEGRRLLLH